MKTTLIYAGIGSRQTPPDVLDYMRNIAGRLAARGYLLRSGAADGADFAFEAGCKAAQGQAEIWLPWQGFNHHADTGFCPTEAHTRMAETVHPAWDRLSRGPKALHSMNVGQILGADLDTPVSFVLCWTPDGCESEATRTRDTGGTGTAIVLASRRGIPVFNLANADAKERLALHVLADCREFHPEGGLPADGGVFVYGDNLAHRHGKGAALVALKQYGAVHGKGGLVGRSYGIPTKDGRPGTPALSSTESVLSLEDIQRHVDVFIAEAKARLDLAFFVTRVGCGLAGYTDKDIAPLFAKAPSNCGFPEVWRPWLGRKEPAPVESVQAPAASEPATDGINIWSGAKGLGGALTNMSERAKEKGCIKHSYPVQVNGAVFADAEAAYQAMKHPGDEQFNDGLMIDLICLKFRQHPKLLQFVTERGGVPWLGRCSHFTQAKTERAQSWEGEGANSRFICNLMHGYQKALSGKGPQTRVTHIREAPYDVYIGRKNGGLPDSFWRNPWVIGQDGTREEVVARYARYVQASPEMMAKVAGLRGRTLGCWCKTKAAPHTLCHGDVLAALAEGREWAIPEVGQRSLF